MAKTNTKKSLSLVAYAIKNTLVVIKLFLFFKTNIIYLQKNRRVTYRSTSTLKLMRYEY